MYMNSYRNPRMGQNRQNMNPFGIDRTSHLSGHFNHGPNQNNQATMNQNGQNPYSNQNNQNRMNQYPNQNNQNYYPNQPQQNQYPNQYQNQPGQNQMNQQSQFQVRDTSSNQGRNDSSNVSRNRQESGKSNVSGIKREEQKKLFDLKLSSEDLRHAMVMNEVLSKPVSRRKHRGLFGRA